MQHRKVIAIDMLDPQDAYIAPIYKRLKKQTPKDFDLLSFRSLEDLLLKLAGHVSLDLFELVGHGSPWCCARIGLASMADLGQALRFIMAKGGQIALTGCNTGCCKGGESISNVLACYAQAPVHGVRGYSWGGTFYEGNNRSTRTYYDTDFTIYCGSLDSFEDGAYKSFDPHAISTVLPFPEMSCDSDLDDLGFVKQFGTLADLFMEEYKALIFYPLDSVQSNSIDCALSTAIPKYPGPISPDFQLVLEKEITLRVYSGGRIVERESIGTRALATGSELFVGVVSSISSRLMSVSSGSTLDSAN
jgi:hypothetical protein